MEKPETQSAVGSTRSLADWQCNEAGWWTADNPQIGVCKELDGKWRSYALKTDTIKNSPAFKTMKAAMMDAETRHRSANDQAHPLGTDNDKRL